jgi:hypothetical protein
MSKPKEPIRKADSRQDLGAIQAIAYNDAGGSMKMIMIDAPIKRAVAGGENIGAGKYIKVEDTSYTLDLLGKAHSTSVVYKKGDIVTQTTDVYMALEDNFSGTFDASKWRKVAPKQVGPIAIVTGTVVTTGRWHNSVTTAGWLVDDESDIPYTRTRD